MSESHGRGWLRRGKREAAESNSELKSPDRFADSGVGTPDFAIEIWHESPPGSTDPEPAAPPPSVEGGRQIAPSAEQAPVQQLPAQQLPAEPVDPPEPFALGDQEQSKMGPAPVSEVVGLVRIPQIVIGTPSPEVEPTFIADGFRTFPFRPDTVVDGWSCDQLTVRGASLRGQFHRYNGAPRQDDFAIHRMSDGRIVALVADGVSQAPQSHLGSSTAVRYAAQWLQANSPSLLEDTDWLGLVRSTAWALTEQAQAMYGLETPDPGKAERELATTLVCAVIEPCGPERLRVFVVGVGDSGAWVLRDDEFVPILGGKSELEGGISSSAVAGLPRVPNGLAPAVVEIGLGEVLLLGTDGIGDPLGSGQGGVGNLFRELFSGTEPPSLVEFANAVDFSRETFDDDRTLIAVMPRAQADGRAS